MSKENTLKFKLLGPFSETTRTITVTSAGWHEKSQAELKFFISKRQGPRKLRAESIYPRKIIKGLRLTLSIQIERK